MARDLEYGTHNFYGIAERFVDVALRGSDSLFTPGVPIWSQENIEDLYQRFVLNPDQGSDTFETKFRKQLAGSPPAIYQLAGELTLVHLMIASWSIKYPAKHGLVTRILNWSPAPVAIPPGVDDVLRGGLAKVGIAYMTYRPFQLGFLLQFVRFWKGLPETQQTEALADPWTFKELLFSLPIHHAYAQREAILHLVHPDTFEPIVSRDHKRKYAKNWAHYAAEQSDDVDRMLLAIREGYYQQHGEPLNFYTQEPGKTKPGLLETTLLPRTLGPRLRPYVDLITHLPGSGYTPAEIVDRLGQISPPIAPDLSFKPDADALVRDLVHLRLLRRTEDGRFRRWSFLDGSTTEILLRYAALTLLVRQEDGSYELPALRAPFDGEPHPAKDWPYGAALVTWYVEAGLAELVGENTWCSLPNALEPIDSQVSSAQALNTFLGHLHNVRERRSDLPAISDEPLPVLDPSTLEERIAELQRVLLIDRMTILRIYRALIAGQHVILSGPPGTGKTHLATMLPRVLWRDAEATRVLDMRTDPSEPPTEPPTERLLERHGYDVMLVTATEDWGVRQVIGGIVPQLVRDGDKRSLIYRVRHGNLTQAILANYAGHNGDDIPEPAALVRQEVNGEGGHRYRGRWLIIDEFTRAPIDAAFGSLLTTLGGQRAPLMVPTDDGHEAPLPLPRDFRIIGTLNSFDRHFLNQISEAMKRRFTFIDILPPGRALAEREQGIAAWRAIQRLKDQGVIDPDSGQIETELNWEDVLHIARVDDPSAPMAVSYEIDYEDQDAHAAVDGFWRIFSAIRVYRQLGTAQAEAVLATLFSGHTIGLSWPDALDSALADVLGDQLQVLARDEQRVLLAYLESASQPETVRSAVQSILADASDMRQAAHLNTLVRAGATAGKNDAPLAERRNALALDGAFTFGTPLPLTQHGLFANRLQSYIDERGL